MGATTTGKETVVKVTVNPDTFSPHTEDDGLVWVLATVVDLEKGIVDIDAPDPLAKFYSEPPASEMELDDVVFQLVWADVVGQADDREPFPDLTSEEMHTFRKCLEAGLGSWSEVVQLSLLAATVGREDAPGAIGRANRFAATGDTNVLLEGLDDIGAGGKVVPDALIERPDWVHPCNDWPEEES